MKSWRWGWLAGMAMMLPGLLCAVRIGAEEAGSSATAPVKLVFIHHSCGENWLADDNGGLGAALAKAGYFVSDTNYGWGPDGIGDRTDIPNWPEWFCGPGSTRILQALFRESAPHSPYVRPMADPGGENRIVMFKSCFPNSELAGRSDDMPDRRGDLTVAGAKGIYLELRQAFLARPDKFFVVVTAPPVSSRRHAKNARAFNTWLVTEWLKGYPGKNVAVFDFYTVLTGKNNHHRIRGGQVEYINDTARDTLAYPSDDDHPSAAGNRKATGEFVPWLDFHVRRWLAANPPAPVAAGPPPPTAGPDPGENQAPSPPLPSPPPSAPTGKDTSANFAISTDGWEVFQDETVAQPMMTVKHQHVAGIPCLAVAYRVKANTWAACAKVTPQPTDWRAYAGLSIRWLAPVGCRPVLTVYEDGPDHGLWHFECPLSEGNGQWQEATIPWVKFRQPEWQGDPKQDFRPERARGLAVILHPGDTSASGEFGIAKVKLTDQ